MTESQLLLNAANIIDDYIKDAFIIQGHSLTSQWENSIQHNSISNNEVEGIGKIYGLIVNEGILPEKIPYGGIGNSSGSISEYILGLQNYWKLRKPGINEKQALRLAFATAEVQKIEGMSTINSEQFSASGKRQNFLSSLKKLFEDYLDDFIFLGLDVIIENNSKEQTKLFL